jgi:formamidopyrimidine-DNA glycosylase
MFSSRRVVPELPEVQTVINSLKPRVLGAAISRVVLQRTDIVTPTGINLPARLTGQTITDLDRRGKRIIFTLATGERFYIHLGMSGRLGTHRPDEPTVKHTHLILHLITATESAGASVNETERGRAIERGRATEPGRAGPERLDTSRLSHRKKSSDSQLELRFTDPRRFGGIWWLGHDESPDGNMGPEPLQTRPAQLAKRLARTSRAIKNALLDQTVIAGLGNIYVDESLFAAAIHPLQPANKLTPDQIGRLSRAIKSTLRKALRHRGSTLRDYRDGDGLPGDFQSRHRVYDREGKSCRKCRTPIERIVLGGRSTHFCPRCQAP